ncbi:tyrosine-type recombinase/integrase [uncultured Hymenobacter sp.]|uniref:tyrosine-type recombinase/integrase n=1 Tax=uncultured Hymenobacter sp. TaxID=170016 RepID=UPI0035CB589C
MHQLTLPPGLSTALAAHPTIQQWLRKVLICDLCASTVEAYAYALQDYLRFCEPRKIDYIAATEADVLRYLANLKKRPIVEGAIVHRVGLSSATRHKYWEALKMYYRHLVKAGIRDTLPLTQDEHTLLNRHGNPRRGVVQVERKLTWIPTHEEWHHFLNCMRGESLRNCLMLALSYECALRKNELCTLQVTDIVGTLLTLRAKKTKMKRDRRSQFSTRTRQLLDLYLKTRPHISGRGGETLFVSEATQNRGQPITDSAWRKVIDRVAERAELPRFTPHTIRRLSANHFADQGYSPERVSRHLGHFNKNSTGRYRQQMPEQLLVGFARVIGETIVPRPQ